MWLISDTALRPVLDDVERCAQHHRGDQRTGERKQPVRTVRAPRHERKANAQRDAERAEVTCKVDLGAIHFTGHQCRHVLDDQHDCDPGERRPHPTVPTKHRRPDPGENRRT